MARGFEDQHAQWQWQADPEMAAILRLFIEELPQRAAAVAGLFRAGDTTGLRRLAHQLKGSCGGYGFPTIGQAAGTVERLLLDGAGLDAITEQVNSLVELCVQAAGEAAGTGDDAAATLQRSREAA